VTKRSILQLRRSIRHTTLHGNGCRLGTDPETSRHDATCAEAGVERAIGVAACEREVGELVDDGRSHRDNFPSNSNALSRSS
jgi:hypothetical protein